MEHWDLVVAKTGCREAQVWETVGWFRCSCGFSAVWPGSWVQYSVRTGWSGHLSPWAQAQARSRKDTQPSSQCSPPPPIVLYPASQSSTLESSLPSQNPGLHCGTLPLSPHYSRPSPCISLTFRLSLMRLDLLKSHPWGEGHGLTED